MSSRERRPLPRNLVAQVFRGFVYPIEALSFVSQHKLWKLTTVPIVVNVVLLAGLSIASAYFLWPELQKLDAWLLGLFEGSLWQSIAAVLSWLVTFSSVVGLVVVNSLLLLLIGQAVASPFLDVLSERIEQIVLASQTEPMTVGRTLRSVMIALSDLVWSLLFLIAINLPIWTVGVVLPGIGTSAAAVLSFSFNALLLSQEFVGLSMARRLVSYRRRWSVLWRNRWVAVGFGSATMVMLVVPGLNLLLLPVAAAGGTLLYCDLAASGRADSA